MEWIKTNPEKNEHILEKYKLYHNEYHKGSLYLWRYIDEELIKRKILPTEPFYIFDSKKERCVLAAKTLEEAKKEALEIIKKEMELKLDRYLRIIEDTGIKYERMCQKIKDCGFELDNKYREYDHLYDMYVDEFDDATEDEIEKWRKENE